MEQAILSSPAAESLPIWVGVGGKLLESFARAGVLGLLRSWSQSWGRGNPRGSRPLVDLYRRSRADEQGIRRRNCPWVSIPSVSWEIPAQEAAGTTFSPDMHKYAFTEIGKERGWPPPTRKQFDAVRGRTGAALLIGDIRNRYGKNPVRKRSLGRPVPDLRFQMGVSTRRTRRCCEAIIEISGN